MGKCSRNQQCGLVWQRAMLILVSAYASNVVGSGSGDEAGITPANVNGPTTPRTTTPAPTIVNVIVEAPSAASLPVSFVTTTLPETLASLTCKYGIDANGDKLVPGTIGAAQYSTALAACALALAVTSEMVHDSTGEPSLLEGQLNIRMSIGMANLGVSAKTVAAAFASAPDTEPGYWLLNTILVRISDTASLTTAVPERTLSANNPWSTTTVSTTTTTTATTTTIYATGMSSLFSELSLTWIVITAVAAVFLVGGVIVFCKYERHTHMQHAEQYLQQLHRAQNPWIAPLNGVQLAADSPTKVVEELIGLDANGHIIPGGPRDATNESNTEDNVAIQLNQPPAMDPAMVEQMTTDILARVKSSDEFAAFSEWQAQEKAAKEAAAAKAAAKTKTPAPSVAPTVVSAAAAADPNAPCRTCKTVGGHLASCSDHPKNKMKKSLGNVLQRRGSTASVLPQATPDWMSQLLAKQKARRASQASLNLEGADLAEADEGNVSLEEAAAMGMDTATFNAIDADGNGQLSRSEVESWRSKQKVDAKSTGKPAWATELKSAASAAPAAPHGGAAPTPPPPPPPPPSGNADASSQGGSQTSHYYPPTQGELKTAV